MHADTEIIRCSRNSQAQNPYARWLAEIKIKSKIGVPRLDKQVLSIARHMLRSVQPIKLVRCDHRLYFFTLVFSAWMSKLCI